MRRSYLLIITTLFLCQNSFAQHADKSWSATGSGNTYTKLQTATGARPQVPCTHSGFTDTAHIDEVMDADLNKHAFRFHIHANVDGNYNQCNPAETKERQRNELAYNVSKPTMKVQYKWQMKLPDNFKTTSNSAYNFAHLHQIKLRDGFYKNQPMFTVSAWKDQLLLITSTSDWQGDRTLNSEPLTNFKGKWVEITEIIVYDEGFSSGRYGIQIKEMHGSKSTLFQFVDNDIQTWKGGAANLQVKWGFYRSRTGFGGSPVFNDLQDEIVLYDNFDVKYINDASPISFNAAKVQLTVNSVNGTVATNPSSADNSYELDAQVTLTATPATGYEFEKWEGAAMGTNNPTTISMNSAKTVTAVFKEKQNLLTITATNGTVTTNPQSTDNRYGQNTQVTLTATPATGYEFEKWEGATTGTTNPTTITMNSAKSVIAVFKQKQNLLSITAINGTVSTNPQSNDNRYGQNTQVTLTAIPATGYEFEKWEGASSGSNNPTTITMNSAKSVIAVFKQKQNLLSITAINGTVSTNPQSNDNRYGQNTQVTLTAIPATGYEFEKWEGASSGSNNPTTITMNSAKSVTAVFKQKQNLLTITATNGTVSTNPQSNDNRYGQNTQVTLSAIPAAGYEFEKWEGAATGITNPITITMNSAKSVTAVFKQKQNLLTLVATNGSVSTNPQSNDNRYGQNTQVTLTATPNTGYEFEKWEGAITGTDNPMVITMDDSKMVTAIFIQKQHLLTLTTENGTVTTNPESSNNQFNQDQEIVLTAMPNDGFEFKAWTGDITGADNPTRITMDMAKTVTAVFEALSTDQELLNTFTMSPNPVKDMLSIDVGDTQELKSSMVYNSRGQVVLKSQKTDLDFSTLSAGMYLLKVECTNNEIIFKKIIKR